MRCYNCGFDAEGAVCPSCGAPLATYRDIMTLSGVYYNDGLDRAQSRDLTGAIRALTMCLKLDKNNISARNLLGLIYYETGETVQAITQWVVSRNLQPEGNPVDGYLDELRNKPGNLERMNRAIKKYNFALRSARKGHLDAARIQLKKSLQLNPHLLKARQLLALLYIRRKDFARARYELSECQKIDIASDKTIRYFKEIDRVVREKNAIREEEEQTKKNGRQQAVAYRSGNDTIIQPARTFGTGGALSVISVVFGLVLGIVTTAMLVVPGRTRSAQMESNERIAAISEESDSRAAKLSEYERQVGELEQQMQTLSSRLEVYEGRDSSTGNMDGLMRAVAFVMSGQDDIAALAGALENVTEEDVDRTQIPGYRTLYDALVASAGSELSEFYTTQGVNAVRDGNYAEAVKRYALAVQYNREDADALYNLAEAVRLSGDSERAKLLYDSVVTLFPGTRRAQDAQVRIVELNN
ncbi:MAG: tetratricopeptide repeat protein [Lachnospiraceae bacterium]|nr:tetratricopeptide repeat protein [Lachnospiraceae bacterium]